MLPAMSPVSSGSLKSPRRVPPLAIVIALVAAALVATAWSSRSTVIDAFAAVRDGQAFAMQQTVRVSQDSKPFILVAMKRELDLCGRLACTCLSGSDGSRLRFANRRDCTGHRIGIEDDGDSHARDNLNHMAHDDEPLLERGKWT